MMARKLHKRVYFLICRVMLQWSRANDGAETGPVNGENRLLSRLQWSRANDGAETGQPSAITTATGMLQWSRANDGAETGNAEVRLGLLRDASMEPRQ